MGKLRQERGGRAGAEWESVGERDTLPGPLVLLIPQWGTNHESVVKRGSRGIPPAHGGSGHRDTRTGREFGGEMGRSPPAPPAPSPARGSPGGSGGRVGLHSPSAFSSSSKFSELFIFQFPEKFGIAAAGVGGLREGTEGGISGSRDPLHPPHQHRPRRWLPLSVPSRPRRRFIAGLVPPTGPGPGPGAPRSPAE